MDRPRAKLARYSTIRSNQIGRLSRAVMTEVRIMPVASPATQWMVLQLST